ncbi:MAG: hypothetical protein ACTHKH_10790 [Trinickia sp.]|jgi:uncharacterized protein YdaT
MEPWVRDKAIDIANALLGEGMPEGKAIRIAIAQAKRWAARRRAMQMTTNDHVFRAIGPVTSGAADVP